MLVIGARMTDWLTLCMQQIYYVKATQDTTQSVLDLNRAEDEQFPPEKLRMTIERFYTSVIVGVTDLFNHVVRLRSWKEPRRTAVFCGVCPLSDHLIIPERFRMLC